MFWNWFPDLRKEFDTPPYSQQIELGSQAELRCHPPKGSPEARVSHWLKNGEKIEDSNLIQSAAGNLLILQARMIDMANYTCVATNDAVERQSQPAAITVFGKTNKHLNAYVNILLWENENLIWTQRLLQNYINKHLNIWWWKNIPVMEMGAISSNHRFRFCYYNIHQKHERK